MTQEYTPVSWQDETTSQQGTLINAERLNQMQTAHHYADGLEEVDTVPTADPGVAYHKIVYCTADNTLYRWDGEAWTADIDDPTRELLEEHEADHDNPHQVTKAQVGLGNADNTSDADKPISTATQTALDTKLTQRYTTAVGREYVYAYTRTQQTAIEASSGMETLTIPIRDSEGAMHAQVPASPQATHVINYGWANTELDKKADKATTYTKSEADTLLGAKANASQLTDGSVTKVGTANVGSDTKPIKLVAGVPTAVTNDLVDTVNNQTVAGRKTFTIPPIAYGNSSTLEALYLKNKVMVSNTEDATTGKNTMLSYIAEDNTPQVRLRYRTGPGQVRTFNIDLYDNTGTAKTMTLAQVVGNGDVTSPMVSNALDGYLPMVRTTGNQTIAGTKTFSGLIKTYSNSTSVIQAVNTNLPTDRTQRGSVKQQAQYQILNSQDTGNIFMSVGLEEAPTYRSAQINLFCPGGEGWKAFALNNDANGTYMSGPYRAYDPTHTTDVATIGTLDAYTPMVRTTGNQTIAGVKTFTAGRTVIQDGTTEMIYRIDTTHGTERYAVIELSNPNNNYNACLQFANMPDGTCKLQFYKYNKSTGTAEVRDIITI